LRHDPARLEAALAPLIGLPLWSSGSAADLHWFQFGARCEVTAQFGPRKGTRRTVGEYALHVQCEWRLLGTTGNVLATRGHSDSWDDSSYVVEAIHADERGGLRIRLSDGFMLEVIPDDAHGEQWRLLRPAMATPHFVVEQR
jgi:hypothetical protein